MPSASVRRTITEKPGDFRSRRNAYRTSLSHVSMDAVSEAEGNEPLQNDQTTVTRGRFAGRGAGQTRTPTPPAPSRVSSPGPPRGPSIRVALDIRWRLSRRQQRRAEPGTGHPPRTDERA